ncbi:MAG: acyl--CoA ligase [Kineosporiaceae bacterium]|nr:acyl--CoA ligase [Kineosporiaceae bacterium]
MAPPSDSTSTAGSATRDRCRTGPAGRRSGVRRAGLPAHPAGGPHLPRRRATCGILAAGLHRLGVRNGEPVVALMGNSVELVLLWLAVARLGAVHVPVNTALIGDGLAHAFRLTRARIAVVDDDLAAPLDAVRDRLPDLQRVVRVPSSEFDELASSTPGSPVPAVVEVDPLEPAIMLFTSGPPGCPRPACSATPTSCARAPCTRRPSA